MGKIRLRWGGNRAAQNEADAAFRQFLEKRKRKFRGRIRGKRKRWKRHPKHPRRPLTAEQELDEASLRHLRDIAHATT